MKKDLHYISSNIHFTPNLKEKFGILWSRKLALLALIVSLITILIVVKQVERYQHGLKTGAAADPAEIFFTPTSSTITPTEKVFPIWINSNTVGVAFARIELNYDHTVLVLTKDPTIISPVMTQIIEVTPATTANTTGKVVITVGLGVNQTAPSGAFQIASLSLKAKSPTTSNSNITISTTNSQLVNPNASIFALTTTPLALSLNPDSGARLYFMPPNPANPETVNTPFTTEIMLDTAGQDTHGVDAVVKYDPTKLRLTLITPTNGNGFTSYPLSNIDNSTGTAKFSANIGTGVSAAAVNGASISVAKLTFTPLSPSTNTALTYDFSVDNRNDSNIILKNANPLQDPIDILTQVTPLSFTINLSPSPSPSPSPHSLTMILGFQGKGRDEVAKNLALSLSYIRNNQGIPVVTPIQTNAMGQASLTLLPGDYVFLIKSPGYLARRFGTTTNPITITDSTTTLNLANSILLGGDLNSDGVVNEVDYTSRFLTVFGTSNALSDLDGSNQVNNLDFSIMRGNWSLIDDLL